MLKSNSQKIAETLKLFSIGLLILLFLRFSFIRPYRNHTDSMPKGWYIVNFARTKVNRGDLVIACFPNQKFAELAVARNYLSPAKHACSWGTEYILKQVMGFPGDLVQVSDDGVYVNKQLVPNSKILHLDHESREMSSTLHTGRLQSNQFLLFGQTLGSFDSRYFGIVRGTDIKGTAYMILKDSK